MDKPPVRSGGAHMRNCCSMWVMTWIHERAGNGTKNLVLYDLWLVCVVNVKSP
jgi:hypothetical protein